MRRAHHVRHREAVDQPAAADASQRDRAGDAGRSRDRQRRQSAIGTEISRAWLSTISPAEAARKNVAESL